MNKTLLACALACAAALPSARAAEIVMINNNAPGVGLNDPTPADPVGNNPGTTVGEQRQIVYQFAADLWGAVLESEEPIRVIAQFTPLGCTATSGTLGSAGARYIQRDFPGAVPLTWYGEALANSIADTDLSPGEPEINSNFNSNLGTPGCLETSGWYYGLDGNTPAGMINFFDVVMHEIGHGLNFQGFHNLTTGAPNGTYTDIYSSFVFDNASGKAWNAMTNAERVIAAKSEGLVWTGEITNSQVPITLAQAVRLVATSGNSTVGAFDYGVAAFGPEATPANFSGPLVAVNDGSAAPNLGCEASPAGAYAGKVALVDRGTCAFEIKVVNAQNAGAIAVVVANNTTGALIMADDATVVATVPAISVSQADGATLRAAANAQVALQAVPGQYAGTDAQGRPRLYAPTTLATGSTFSHFDVSHTPNAVMEPAINDDLDANMRLDLTPALFADLGWGINTGNATTRGGACNAGVPVVLEGGLVAGANLQAADAMCRGNTEGTGDYRRCIAPFVAAVRNTGLVRNKIQLSSCTIR
jgi:hypothetical protein